MNRLLKELRSSDVFMRLPLADYLPRWCVLILDVLLCSLAYWVSIWIGHGLFEYQVVDPFSFYWKQYAVWMVVQIVGFNLFHTYSGILRYSTFVDTLKSLFAVFGTVIFLMLCNQFIRVLMGEKWFLDTALCIYGFIAFVLLFCLRVGVKTLYEAVYQVTQACPKVLIFGTKSAGVAIAKMLRNSGNSPYRPVGFIGETNKKMKYELAGLHVFPLNDKLFDWMAINGIQHVIVSPLKMREINPSVDLKVFLEHNIRILTTPSFTQFDRELDYNRIGKIDAIQIEDLLERPKIEISTDNVNSNLHDKVVMVTGAAGSIGSELVRQIITFNPQMIILFEQAESPLHDLVTDLRNQYPNARLVPIVGDVRDCARIESVMQEYHPEIVYHAAAYKHVPLMEEHPNEAVHANVLGSKNMADMSVKYGVERFVMISTDKAVNPTNIMGASKRIAEMYVQSLFKDLVRTNPNCTKFITTRFGNVLGSNGSVIPYFKKQIAQRGPVTVTHPDITRYFMTIPEACCLVLEASTLGNGGEIFVFDMGHPVKILDLAKNMIRLAGLVPGQDVPISFIGLRPGEKLYEEVLNKKETTLPTQHEKIMIAKVREFPFDEINRQVDTLLDISKDNKPFMTVKQMKVIVPEYKSKNSVYESLDV